MKITLSTICLVLAFACSSPPATESIAIELPKWLEGSWVRTNGDQANITYEQWNSTSEDEFAGLGFTIQIDSNIFRPDTIFMERMRILAINDTLNLEIKGVNEVPTLFEFIAQTDTSFICVNPENDFPKKISYTLSEEHITAVISGPGQDITFLFRRE